MFFRRKKEVSNPEKLNQMLSLSFQNVSKDIYNIFSWLNYLNERILSLQKELDYVPKSKEEIKRIIDQHYSFENLTRRISELNERVDELNARQKSVPVEIDEIRSRIKNMATVDDISSLKPRAIQAETPPQNSRLDEINQRLKHIESSRQMTVREKFVQRITRNSKEYVKNVIITLIRKYQKIPALKLKEMVVDEQGLCSKSSFYRILTEVEEGDEITIIRKGKEKLYELKMIKKL